MSDVRFLDPQYVEDARIYYVTAVARYRSKWIFARHKKRSSWDMPGGRREPGETPTQAMARELWEETGAVKADIHMLCAYEVDAGDKLGMLFYADVEEMGPLPEEFEMEEVCLLDRLPQEQTYPGIYPALFLHVQGWLNAQSNPGELWDVYDAMGKPTGKLHRRGEPMLPDEYHLVVHIWMLNSKGEFLLTKRSANKGFPNMWESTGGSALSGEDSLRAALREVREETGLCLDPVKGTCIFRACQADYIRDVWLFRQDFELKEVVLQPGETTDKMYANKDAVLNLYESGMLVPYDYLWKLLDFAGL